jgi:4-hydroxy-2-oxoheptanedioate aldolase
MHLIRAVENAGGQTIVRVPWNDQVYLKRILDIGAQSLMIPMINDKASAEEAVAACRYPPQGRRGYAAPVLRASGYGVDEDYGKNANDELLLIAQIEHVDACDNIEEIAAVDGIDMLFIGPNDLAGSMGHFENMQHDDVTAKVAEIERRVTATGKMLGGFPIPGTPNDTAEQLGYRIIAGQADVWIFKTAAEKLAVK